MQRGRRMTTRVGDGSGSVIWQHRGRHARALLGQGLLLLPVLPPSPYGGLLLTLTLPVEKGGDSPSEHQSMTMHSLFWCVKHSRQLTMLGWFSAISS